jgi:serine protease Do
MNRGRSVLLGIKSVVAIIVIAAVLCGVARGAFTGDEQKAVKAVKMVKPSVVSIQPLRIGSSKPGLGSGVIISPDGYIITNAHVVKGANTIRVFLHSGEFYSARVWRASPTRDLAILKITPKNKLPVPRFGDSNKLELGQMAIAIGNPMRFSWTVTIGTISALNRDLRVNGVNYTDLIQTDVHINPGSSGGALVNSSGEVIGINTLVYTGEGTGVKHVSGLSFAIPINDALSIAKDLIKTRSKASERPWLGLSVKELTRQDAEMYDYVPRSGLYVQSVVVHGPAARAGIQSGDVVTRVDTQPIRQKSDLAKVMQGVRIGQTLEVEVWYQGKKKRVVKVVVEGISQ